MKPEDQETWEERAAIMEYDAGLPRARAERMARRGLQPSSGLITEPPADRQTPGYLAFREFKQHIKL